MNFDVDSGRIWLNPNVEFEDVPKLIRKTIQKPKATPIKGGKPQERLALGVQATVPPGKIKVEPPKKEGLFAAEKPKAEQLTITKIDDKGKKLVKDFTKSPEPKPTKKARPQIDFDPLDDVVLTGVKLRKGDFIGGKLRQEMKALQDRFGPRIFTKDPNAQSLDEIAASFGETEESLRQKLLIHVSKTERAKNLKELESFFEAQAKFESEQAILSRGAKTEGLIEETAQFGATVGPIKIPRIRIKVGEDFKPPVKFTDPGKELLWNQSRGVPNESIFQKVIENARDVQAGFTRTFIHLPSGDPFFAPAKETLRQLRGSAGASSREAVEVVKQLTKDIRFEDLDLATRKLKLEDYLEGLTKEERIKAPFAFTEEEAATEILKINDALKSSPKAQRLVNETRALLDEVGQELVKFDILKDAQIKNKNYFRRQILKYATQSELYKPGAKLKRPKPGFAKRRVGAELPDNTDYLQAMYSYLADAKHDIRIAKSLRKLRENYDIFSDLKFQFGKKWIDNIPDGYKAWPEDIYLFKTHSVSDKIASELLDITMTDQLALFAKQGKKQIVISADDLRQIRAIGKKMWVIPEELYNQLNDLKGEALTGGIGSKFIRAIGIKAVTTAWKKWTLLSPKRWIQYNFRNFIGDSEAVFAAQPQVFKKVPQATKELREYFFEAKPMSKELREFNDRGGIGSSFVQVEISKLNKVRDFERFYAKTQLSFKDIAKAPLKEIGRAWGKLVELTEFREDILRYASYLHYRNQALAKNITNFGASSRKEILALSEPLDQAAKLSRELLGDYDAITRFGQDIRNSLIPFYSWMEINAKRWPRLIANSIQDSKGAFARTGSVFAGKAAAGFAVRMAHAYAVTYVWNNFVAPQIFGENIESELSEFDRNRLHISLGRNNDGTVKFIRTPTATSDFLEWFGFNELPVFFDLVSRGVINWGDAMVELAKVPVKKIVNGLNPAFKLPAELLTRKSTFPDVFEPAPVIDRWDHFLRTWQLEDIYRKVNNIPTRKTLSENLRDKMFLISEYNPDEIAYYDILRLKRKFKSKILGQEAGSGISPRSQMYRNYKKATQFGQRDVADAILKELAQKGWLLNLEQSLRASHPLFGIKQEDKNKFIGKFLNSFQRKKLMQATRYYNRVLDPSKIPLGLKIQSRLNKKLQSIGQVQK